VVLGQRSDDSGAEKVREEEASNVRGAEDAGPRAAAIVVVMGRGGMFGVCTRMVTAKVWDDV
jgi:hypothetical protein